MSQHLVQIPSPSAAQPQRTGDMIGITHTLTESLPTFPSPGVVDRIPRNEDNRNFISATQLHFSLIIDLQTSRAVFSPKPPPHLQPIKQTHPLMPSTAAFHTIREHCHSPHPRICPPYKGVIKIATSYSRQLQVPLHLRVQPIDTAASRSNLCWNKPLSDNPLRTAHSQNHSMVLGLWRISGLCTPDEVPQKPISGRVSTCEVVIRDEISQSQTQQ